MRTLGFAMLFASLGGLSARAEDCNRFAVSVATDPAPYQYPRGLEKADELLGSVPRQADTILLGDSLMANWPVDMLHNQFRSNLVWNIAVGGSVSQNTLWQLDKLSATGLKPKQVIVLTGTNNLTRDDMPACAIASGIKAVTAAAHRKWPDATLHVMGIPPRGPNFHFRDDARLAVNSEIRSWTGDLAYLRYFEVDASEMTCGQYDKPVQIAAAGGHVAPGCENYADDFGHFKRAGYDVIFKALTGK